MPGLYLIPHPVQIRIGDLTGLKHAYGDWVLIFSHIGSFGLRAGNEFSGQQRCPHINDGDKKGLK